MEIDPSPELIFTGLQTGPKVLRGLEKNPFFLFSSVYNLNIDN